MFNDLKYNEIKKLSQDYLSLTTGSKFSVKILTNITISPLKDYLEAALRQKRVNAFVDIGDFDNIMQESSLIRDWNSAFVFWDMTTIIKNAKIKGESLSDVLFDELYNALSDDLNILFNSLEAVPLVLFNKFSSLFYCLDESLIDGIRELTNKLNKKLDILLKKNNNVKLIDIEKIILECEEGKSFDHRFFEISSAPYTLKFIQSYAEKVLPFLLGLMDGSKKVLAIDCDNTLWKGVIGEDGIEGIVLGGSGDGRYFKEVQSKCVSLSKTGTVVCLLSKNNPEEVDNVIKEHKDMLLVDEHIVLKRVNWEEKYLNIRSIASELNLGLDSFVFVDDSSFEIEQMKAMNPEVTSIQVPSDSMMYPLVFNQLSLFFWRKNLTLEDEAKTSLYKSEIDRRNELFDFKENDKYLDSMRLKIKVFTNYSAHCNRAYQLLQKTNQFNMTTRRHSLEDVERFFKENGFRVFTADVEDKYGSYGVTGLCIVKFISSTECILDSFLFSCRVLGRKCEFSFLDFVMSQLFERGVKTVNAMFLPTSKNKQVTDFYEKCGFKLKAITDDVKRYEFLMEDYIERKVKHIEVYSE